MNDKACLSNDQMNSLHKVFNAMLLRRRWAFLRYLHLRKAFCMTEDVETYLGIGAGDCLSELAIAIEFPNVHFLCTEPEMSNRQDRAKAFIKSFRVKNMTFGAYDGLVPGLKRYDMVSSIEVLEHIENDSLAAAEMRASSNKYVFALVPFADKEAQSNEEENKRQFEVHGHYRTGYDAADLTRLFPNIIAIRGAYWRKYGIAWRRRITDMSDEDVINSRDELHDEALTDTVEAVQNLRFEALAIWMLAKV